MTRDEKRADGLLLDAKASIRAAFGFIDPVATEPVAKAILKALDAIDAARAALKRRTL